jgi:hypothetical protein
MQNSVFDQMNPLRDFFFIMQSLSTLEFKSLHQKATSIIQFLWIWLNFSHVYNNMTMSCHEANNYIAKAHGLTSKPCYFWLLIIIFCTTWHCFDLGWPYINMTKGCIHIQMCPSCRDGCINVLTTLDEGNHNPHRQPRKKKIHKKSNSS